MDILFNQEYAVTMYAKGLEEKAHARGLSEGMSRGMSKGLSQGLSQGLNQGLREGKEDGKLLSAFRLILAKQQKNKSLETAAEEMEVEPEAIRGMYFFVQSHSEQSAEELLELWKRRNRKRGHSRMNKKGKA